MHTSTILSNLLPLLTITSALPSLRQDHAPHPTNFLLVTTTQSTPSTNSSLLANVNATSLFDPFDQEAYLIRLIGPGYGGLPKFNLSGGALHSWAEGVLGFGNYDYNSTQVMRGKELSFLPSTQPKQPKRRLGLRDGYLLTVGGRAKGWTICGGSLGQQTVSLPVGEGDAGRRLADVRTPDIMEGRQFELYTDVHSCCHDRAVLIEPISKGL